MSGILAWVKSHLLIVVSVALIVILLPAAFVGAGMWNGKIREAAQKAYSDEERKLSQHERVQYSLPSVYEGEAAVEATRAPNPRVTSFFKEQREAREHQVGRIVELATEMNRAGHGPLVEGLLPEASSPRARAERARELARRLAAPAGGVDEYDALVRRLGGGEPPDPEDVAAVLTDAEQREREKLGPGAAGDRVLPEQQAALREEMVAHRVRQYAARAGDLTFYVRPGLFDGPSGVQGASAWPTPEAARGTPTELETYVWHWDFWVVEDVLRAVSRANSDEAGVALGVADAPVKRVDGLTISAFTPPAADDGMGGASASRGGAGPTYTGRLAQQQEEYDVRMVRLEAVVSPEGLPRLFDALARVNAMTVTGVTLERLDPWDDLAAGYYFGPGPVARAVIEIETIWLRAWTSELMPASVRQAMGIVVPGDEAAGEAGYEEEP